MFYVKAVFIALLAMVSWVGFLSVTALYGWWHEPIAPPGQTRVFMDAAIKLIEEKNHGNAALVLIEAGQIYEEHYFTSNEPITRDTLFPAASMSKWIAAWGVMRLVESGRVDLDLPVSNYLTR